MWYLDLFCTGILARHLFSVEKNRFGEFLGDDNFAGQCQMKFTGRKEKEDSQTVTPAITVPYPFKAKQVETYKIRRLMIYSKPNFPGLVVIIIFDERGSNC